MTQTLNLHTAYTELEEFVEAFATRVDEENLMLPFSQHLEEGEWVQFGVSLADGTNVLEGVGRVHTVVDNGDEFPQEQRFDIVLESLQFEEHAEEVYSHMLDLRGAGQDEVQQISADESGVLVEDVPADVADAGTEAAVELYDDDEVQAISLTPEDNGAAVSIESDASELLQVSFDSEAPEIHGSEPMEVAVETPPQEKREKTFLKRPSLKLQPPVYAGPEEPPWPNPTGRFAYPGGQLPPADKPVRPDKDSIESVPPPVLNPNRDHAFESQQTAEHAATPSLIPLEDSEIVEDAEV